MRSNYAASLRRVLVHEGGYSNHPSDPGGATMRGVIQKVYDAYRDNRNLPRRNVREISEAEIQAIYRKQYWDAIHGDDLPAGVDYCVFDGAVNSGPSQAVKWLQRALGTVGVDGNVGAVTIKEAHDADAVALVGRICDQRLVFLKKLRTWGTFGKGWGRRMADVRKTGMAMAQGQTRIAKAVSMKADETGKAMEEDTNVTSTPEGKSGTEQVVSGGSGGIFMTITGYFQQASDFLSNFTGLPPEVSKWIIGGVAGLAGLTFVGLLARGGWSLLQMWLNKRRIEAERKTESEGEPSIT